MTQTQATSILRDLDKMGQRDVDETTFRGVLRNRWVRTDRLKKVTIEVQSAGTRAGRRLSCWGIQLMRLRLDTSLLVIRVPLVRSLPPKTSGCARWWLGCRENGLTAGLSGRSEARRAAGT